MIKPRHAGLAMIVVLLTVLGGLLIGKWRGGGSGMDDDAPMNPAMYQQWLWEKDSEKRAVRE